jgi:hypothetical protein
MSMLHQFHLHSLFYCQMLPYCKYALPIILSFFKHIRNGLCFLHQL